MNLRSHLLQLHVAVLLLGMTGLFGKFLDLNPMAIIAGRSFFTVICIFCILHWLKVSISLRSVHHAVLLLGSGLVLTLHWFTFFHSIQLSTVAVGMIGFSTYPVFVTFLEPFFFRERFLLTDIVSGILVCIGLIFVAPSFDFANTQTQALLWAVMAGFTAAVLTLLNRQLVRHHHFFLVTFYQHGVAFVFTLPLVVYFAFWPSVGDIWLLAILGLLFTAVPQSLLMRGLKVVKAQFASVLVGLEPLYAIIFAIILLGEIPQLSTIIGGVIVLAAVALASWSHANNKRIDLSGKSGDTGDSAP